MSQLIWQIVKNNSSFLRKQKDNGTSFATEPGNVTQENRFRHSGFVRDNTISVTTDANAKEGTHYPLQVVSGVAGTSNSKVARLVGGKKGKTNKKGYFYNAERINAAAAANGTRHGIRRAALARWSKLTAANKKVRGRRERAGR